MGEVITGGGEGEGEGGGALMWDSMIYLTIVLFTWALSRIFVIETFLVLEGNIARYTTNPYPCPPRGNCSMGTTLLVAIASLSCKREMFVGYIRSYFTYILYNIKCYVVVQNVIHFTFRVLQ